MSFSFSSARRLVARLAVRVAARVAAQCGLAAGLLVAAGVASAQAQTTSAAQLPIADAHFHLMRFMKPEELKERMDRHNIPWVVSAGAFGGGGVGNPWLRDQSVKELLGDRWIPAVGGFDFYWGEKTDGTRYLTDPNNARRLQDMRKFDSMLSFGDGHYAIAETLPNATTSSADPLYQRRVPTNAPFFTEMLALAAKYKIPLGMHMQWHPASVAELEALAASNRDGTIVLMHCGKDATARDIRPILEKHPNIYCDLSYRSPPQETHNDPARTIFWPKGLFRKAGIKPEWKQLIEDFPDRFMVGVDDVHDWKQYDQVVEAIRTGVLEQLSPETAEQVAWKNAVRLFRLKPL